MKRLKQAVMRRGEDLVWTIASSVLAAGIGLAMAALYVRSQ